MKRSASSTALDEAYRSEVKRSTFLDPRQNFAPHSVETEFRYDPLTGQSSRICHFSRDKMPAPDLSRMVEESKGFCPFCPGLIEKVTPHYPPELLAEGFLTCGSARLFPNLFPYDDVSAVAAITDQHFVPMDDFPVEVIANGLNVARAFFERLEAAPTPREVPFFNMVTWNYMPPSGSSLIHPHMQVLSTSNPGNALRRELAAEAAYFERSGRPFHADLLDHERRHDKRWIGEHGGVQWLVPYAPVGMIGDCQAIFPGKATLSDLSADEILYFARGLHTLLKCFADYGLWSFNLAFFPAAIGSAPDRHWLNARVVPRIFVNPMTSAADASYLQFVIEERVAMVYPEVTAMRLREGWNLG
ncbi:MAG: hypothetical protein IT471_10215 [Pseudomonadales bacterium]|jgi:UDPglucose--hexose-1-phosphate uridylyltransferase|nr:hypothetical protein [Pseudomonadales bacterium]MCP5331921.1 hypothetical protein [Pseudomonadales bacterium]HMU91096.1 hypothetical protein [Pseudomonadales bacterium]HMW15391.1 hypothetical protein [Pseudomonadales bacterium]HMW83595.1 hypothetical protein [Pseudomonadales bacterium]